MLVRWTDQAVEALEEIHDFIAHENPQAASRIVTALVSTIDGLEVFPNRGRPGREPGTREIIVRPYIITYEVFPNGTVVIIDIFHGRMNKT